MESIRLWRSRWRPRRQRRPVRGLSLSERRLLPLHTRRRGSSYRAAASFPNVAGAAPNLALQDCIAIEHVREVERCKMHSTHLRPSPLAPFGKNKTSWCMRDGASASCGRLLRSPWAAGCLPACYFLPSSWWSSPLLPEFQKYE